MSSMTERISVEFRWNLVYLYFIQTKSCTLFKTHSHSHLKHTTKHPTNKYIRHAHTHTDNIQPHTK